jgi:hypothetical protein
MAPSACSMILSDIHNEWDDMGDYKELLVLMRKDFQQDGSLHCRFPLVRSDSETAISKGRRRKPDDTVEIPHLIQIPECTDLKNERSCLQLTFDGNVISVGAGERRAAYPDFGKALRRSRKKSQQQQQQQQDALQLTFDGNVITVKEGQAFPDFAAALKKHQRNRKNKKSLVGYSSFQGIIQSVLHVQ